MKVLRILIWIVASLVGLFVLFLLFTTIDNYNPLPEESQVIKEEASIVTDSVVSLVTWNIGYAGLDSSMDFFYDGGKKVRPEKRGVRNNLKGILKRLETFKGADFILLQEVDIKSKRSYKFNIHEMINQVYDEYHSSFGKNYDVAFVPLPPTEPMGRVISGIQTLSRPSPEEVSRYSYPGNYSWPMSLFMLDRCFLMNRYKLESGYDLVVINTHNSAYDDGTLRQQQMNFLKDILMEEYEAGNYVIAGGDWNQCPPGFRPEFDGENFDTEDLSYIDPDYPASDWQWAYDPGIPTNRRVMIPYEKGQTPTTVIDFFLISPNIELLDVHGMDLNFEFTDHQPTFIKVKLRQR
ncbi:endonuclease/exonuclease/phosphatase family protein [Bacteroidota bacterium]